MHEKKTTDDKTFFFELYIAERDSVSFTNHKIKFAMDLVM